MSRAYLIVDAEGHLQGPIVCSNNLDVKGAANGLSWDATVAPYDVYCAQAGVGGGSYGYVGQSPASGFLDDNILPDFSRNLDLPARRAKAA